MNEPALRCAMCGAFWTNHHLCPGPRAPVWQHDNGRGPELLAMTAEHCAAWEARAKAAERALFRTEERMAAAEALLWRVRPYFPLNRNDADSAWEYNDIEERDDLIAIRRDIDALAPKEKP